MATQAQKAQAFDDLVLLWQNSFRITDVQFNGDGSVEILGQDSVGNQWAGFDAADPAFAVTSLFANVPGSLET